MYETPLATKSTLELTARFCECLWSRLLVHHLRLLLTAKSTPFLSITQRDPRSNELFNKVIAKEGDIFDECVIKWEPVKELVLRGIFKGVQAFEYIIGCS